MISINIEIPETLYAEYQRFLDAHVQWDQDAIVTAGLALFLMQNPVQSASEQKQAIARIYLDSLFKRGVA